MILFKQKKKNRETLDFYNKNIKSKILQKLQILLIFFHKSEFCQKIVISMSKSS